MKNQLLAMIDHIQETSSCYYLDFLPQKMDSDRYFKLEEFLQQTYLNEFSKKIIRITVKIIGYYPTKICLTEFPKGQTIPCHISCDPGEEISDISMNDLSVLIDYIESTDRSSVQILFGNSFESLMSINGGFSIDFFNLTKEEYALLSALASQEGLFLKKELKS